ncbi:hypothetical protein SLS62_000611 [Diatrype stigma]|uniref:Multidrug and toxin extrusion protein n=1 Tax=Diatrype stigma TaxID=117547 RepID=A0AAN9YUM0_9PEZI
MEPRDDVCNEPGRGGGLSAMEAETETETTPLLRHIEPVPEPDLEPVKSHNDYNNADGNGYDEDSNGGSWYSELALLARYSVPLIATYLLQYSHSVITTFVAGHLGADALAAASIGMTTMNIVGYATVEGMATALDTLCAQAYGSGHLRGVGAHVQRMLVLMAVTIVPIAAVWAVSPRLLSLFLSSDSHSTHEDGDQAAGDLAASAGAFLRWSIVGLPGYAAFEALKRFLQAQGAFRPAVAILVLCAPANALLSWLLAFRWGMGLEGAALGAALTNDLRPLLLLLYLVCFPGGRRALARCWGGLEPLSSLCPFPLPTREASSSWRATAAAWAATWGPMVRLSIAGSAVNLGEWAAFELVAFSTSYLSTRHLAAQSVLTTASIVAWHVPFSISVAASTRVGHLVGSGRLPLARRASLLYGAVFLAVGCADGLVLYVARDALARFFSDDAVVRELAVAAAASVAVFQVVDAVICGTNGVLRGLGRQDVAACVVFVVNYAAAVPLAVWLELGSPRWGLDGVWIGVGAGMVLIAVVECVYMKVLRWQDCVDVVKLREGL